MCVPALKGKWHVGNKCQSSKDVIFRRNGECYCGVENHHYHCPECGKIFQVG